MKILVHSDAKVLHNKTYEFLVKSSLTSDEIIVDRNTYNSKELLSRLLSQASSSDCDLVMLLLLEQAVSLWSLFSLWIHIALHKKKKPLLAGFYFKYDKFFGVNRKGILLSLFFRISGIDLVFISDPLCGRRPIYSLLRSKYRYVCDPCFSLWSNTENNYAHNTDMFSRLNIACLGYLSQKKSIGSLLSVIASPHVVKHLRANRVHFIMAGILDPKIQKKYFSLIRQLVDTSIVTLVDRFLDEEELDEFIVHSDFTWCVQSFFSCSSGIFSRSVALGTSPIVQESSILADSCRQYGFGHIVDFRRSTPSCFNDLISRLTIAKRDTFLEKKGMRCYYENNSADVFRRQVKSALQTFTNQD